VKCDASRLPIRQISGSPECIELIDRLSWQRLSSMWNFQVSDAPERLSLSGTVVPLPLWMSVCIFTIFKLRSPRLVLLKHGVSKAKLSCPHPNQILS
jgi:hypothetical protein